VEKKKQVKLLMILREAHSIRSMDLSAQKVAHMNLYLMSGKELPAEKKKQVKLPMIFTEAHSIRGINLSVQKVIHMNSYLMPGNESPVEKKKQVKLLMILLREDLGLQRKSS
jgi:hypothetical protein